MSGRAGIGVAAVLVLLACSVEDEPAGTACQTNEQCAEGFVCNGGVCVAAGSSGASESDEDSGDEDGSSSGGGEGSSGSTGATTEPPPTTMPPMTTGDDGDACEPDHASFLLGEDMILRSSIGFDPGGPSCAAASSDSPEPQILFEVRMTGKIDATGYGVEITESTHGQVFSDPPLGDSQNIDLPIELNITITATIGGTPALIHFRFSELGPSLEDVSVEWG